MNLINSPLIPVLFELLAKSGFILVVALLVASALRLSAARRHSLWLTIFVVLLLLPLTKSFSPRWLLPGSPSAAAPVVLSLHPSVASALSAVETVPVGAVQNPFRGRDPRLLGLGVWWAGAMVILAYRLLGSGQIAWIKRRSVNRISARIEGLARTAADEMQLRQRVDVRLAEAVRVPCTWGLWRSVVLLPTSAENWTDEHLLAALRHECAHIARRDYLARWVALISTALYWPNPLVWIAARRLCAAQEQACDDLVLQAGTPSSDYASLLIEAARTFTQPGTNLRAAVAMARPSTLEGRVLAIVDERRDRRPAGWCTVWTCALFAAGIVSTSALAQVAPERPVSELIQKNPAPVEVVSISGKSAALEKAKHIVVPEINFQEVTLSEAVDLLRKKSAELDPDKTGVNLVLGTGVDPGVKISLRLNNLSLDMILEFVARIAGLDLVAEPKAFVFQVSRSAALDKAKQIVLPAIVSDNISLAGAVDMLRKLSAQLDPDHTGVNIVLDKGVDPGVRTNLRMRSVRLDRMLEFLADSFDVDLVAEPQTLVFRVSKPHDNVIRFYGKPSSAPTAVPNLDTPTAQK